MWKDSIEKMEMCITIAEVQASPEEKKNIIEDLGNMKEAIQIVQEKLQEREGKKVKKGTGDKEKIKRIDKQKEKGREDR